MKHFILLPLVTFLLYLASSFVAWEINPEHWGGAVRALAGCLWIMAAFMIVVSHPDI